MAEPQSDFWQITNDTADAVDAELERSLTKSMSRISFSTRKAKRIRGRRVVSFRSVDELFDWDKFERDLENKLFKTGRKAGRKAARKTSREIGQSVDIGRVDSLARKRAKRVARLMRRESQKSMDRAIRRMRDLGWPVSFQIDTLEEMMGLNQQQVLAVLKQAEMEQAEKEEPESKVKARIKKASAKFRKDRAKRVARHEAKQAAETAQNEAVRQAVRSKQIKRVRVRWVSIKDQRRDPICERLHGQTIPFTSSARFRDPMTGKRYKGPPEPHQTCRCGKHFIFQIRKSA